MTDDELKELRDYLRKEPEKKKMTNQGKTYGCLPYILISIGFGLSVFLMIMAFDKILMPSIVDEKKSAEVPNLVGIQLDEAKMILAKRDLSYEIAAKQFSTQIQSGAILNQTPAAETIVKSGRVVKLTVSKGSDSVRVPKLVGHPFRKAEVLLMRSGLKLGDTLLSTSEVYPADTVISQSLTPGIYVEIGKSVDLTISKGSHLLVKLPDIRGLTIEEARDTLEQLGLELGRIEFIENDGTFLPYAIDTLDPTPGSHLPPGTLIHIKAFLKPDTKLPD